MTDMIHIMGPPRRLAKKTRSDIVMIKITSMVFTKELHRLASTATLITFFPMNGEASSIPSQPGSSLDSALLLVAVSMIFDLG
jgi:hypothetical protein